MYYAVFALLVALSSCHVLHILGTLCRRRRRCFIVDMSSVPRLAFDVVARARDSRPIYLAMAREGRQIDPAMEKEGQSIDLARAREGQPIDLARAREGRPIDRLRCHDRGGMEAVLMDETTW